MQAHLLPQLVGDHLHLQDLLLLLARHLHQACLPPEPPLQALQQGEVHPLPPLFPQHKAPVVEVPEHLAWLPPLLEPNSGKLARRRPQEGPQPPKLRAVEALVGDSWKR